jgi:hypothetical protein
MKPHDRADRAIDEAAADIAGALNKLMDKIYAMPDVAPDYAIERLLLHLAGDLASLVNKVAQPGSATLRLSNALADYRDSRLKDR